MSIFEPGLIRQERNTLLEKIRDYIDLLSLNRKTPAEVPVRCPPSLLTLLTLTQLWPFFVPFNLPNQVFFPGQLYEEQLSPKTRKNLSQSTKQIGYFKQLQGTPVSLIFCFKWTDDNGVEKIGIPPNTQKVEVLSMARCRVMFRTNYNLYIKSSALDSSNFSLPKRDYDSSDTVLVYNGFFSTPHYNNNHTGNPPCKCNRGINLLEFRRKLPRKSGEKIIIKLFHTPVENLKLIYSLVYCRPIKKNK